MKRIFLSPHKYIQGRGVIHEIGQYSRMIAPRAMIVWDEFVEGLVGEAVKASMHAQDFEEVHYERFAGETTHAEAERLAQIIRDRRIEVIIPVGGGKTLDVAKGAAVLTSIRVMTVPTIASNDSPTSAATVWYDDDGNCMGFDCWPFNPEIVLVDSEIIAKGPVQAFVSGMGDALATWIEAEAAYRSRANNLGGALSTMAALHLAKLGFDTLLEYGVEAKRAVECGACTPAVEKVIEANVLLSGLGFESGGVCTAHDVANILPVFPETHHLMHGEKVGFGIITQLCLDDEMDSHTAHDIVDFEIAVGLPVTFEDQNLADIGRERLEITAGACAAEGSLTRNFPFAVTKEDVIDALLAADALGRARKAARGQS